jgi:hypothetical protein
MVSSPAVLSTATAVGVTSTLHGPYVQQVRMAHAMGGSLMLVGPTGNGKTTLALDAFIRTGWGVELAVLHKGKRINVLQGSYVRTGERGEDGWRFAPGAVARFARRVSGGERVGMIFDEVARAEEKVFAFIMDCLNLYTAEEIAAMLPKSGEEESAMKLVYPADFGLVGERYHIIDVDPIQRRYVLPSSRVRIVGTANQGEGYEGHEFRDPAFLRRWYHWLPLPGYDADVLRAILCANLGVASVAGDGKLVERMLQVNRELYEYQKREDALKMILCLPLLIAWGQQTIWYFASADSTVRGDLDAAFALAARHAWLARVCPYKGENLDTGVENKLSRMVTNATPSGVE